MKECKVQLYKLVLLITCTKSRFTLNAHALRVGFANEQACTLTRNPHSELYRCGLGVDNI